MFVSHVQDEYVEGHRLTAWPMPLVAVGKVEHRGSKKTGGYYAVNPHKGNHEPTL